MAFISGHLNVTEEEFNTYYREKIDFAITCGHNIVIGDARGADLLAQTYLTHVRPYTNVTIYHMFDAPRNNIGGWKTVGGFITDDGRDAAMTSASHYDIAWMRDPERNSGTRRNIMRRTKK